MRSAFLGVAALTLTSALPAQQLDSSYTPLIRAGHRMTGAWIASRKPDASGLRVDRYQYLGKEDEHVSIALNAGFGGVLLVVHEVNGKLEPIAATDSLQATSTLELKLPRTGPYYILAGARLPGSYTLAVTSAGSVSDFEWGSLYPGGGDPSERYALLVGVNDYPGDRYDLKGGPLVDVDLMREVLIARHGFLPRNIVVLRDVEGNREQIIQAFRRHLGQAGPRGVALFYYSGHGMRLPENRDPAFARDTEADDRDEALAVWGSQDDLYGYLLDDELGVLVDELRTDRVLVILDACHTGTATRGAEAVTWSELMGAGNPPPAVLRRHAGAYTPLVQDKRVLGGDIARALERSGSTVVRKDGPRKEPILLAAAADDESALGVAITLDDGTPIQVGLFTLLLYQHLREAPAGLTFQALHQKLAPLVAQHATKISGKPQNPQASGAALRQDIARFLAKTGR